MACPVIALAQQLIKRPSISPNDAGCQTLLTQHLQSLGFMVEPMDFADTQNTWAIHHSQTTGPTLLFAGHTDIVPTGEVSLWHSPPFTPTIKNGMLYGRGAADMKGSLAAMIVAAERFIHQYPDHIGRLAFLFTSDEEATAINGTERVVNELIARQETIDYCIVGEPSSQHYLGDTIKNGRRGSLTGNLTIHGTQGHVAYPELADNPIHRALPFLDELTHTIWDQGNRYFPATHLQIANIYSGTGSNNVIPADLNVQFNLRFSTELNELTIKERVNALLKKHQLRYSINWQLSGQPFLTAPGVLIDTVSRAVKFYTEHTPVLRTNGGTSDGRFIAKTGAEIIELGPVNTTIHQINECVKATDLQLLSRIYQRIMEQLLL